MEASAWTLGNHICNPTKGNLARITRITKIEIELISKIVTIRNLTSKEKNHRNEMAPPRSKVDEDSQILNSTTKNINSININLGNPLPTIIIISKNKTLYPETIITTDNNRSATSTTAIPSNNINKKT